jgi:hypothetical protein
MEKKYTHKHFKSSIHWTKRENSNGKEEDRGKEPGHWPFHMHARIMVEELETYGYPRKVT